MKKLMATYLESSVNEAVIIEGLRYSYPPLSAGGEPIPVLRGVDLRVKRGEFLALMGPTGCGKTTLCLTLNGIVPHALGGEFAGRVVVAGLDTSHHTIAEMSERVGLVFQDAESQLFTMTVEEEVAFGLESLGVPPDEIRERIRWALTVVRMEDLVHRSPLRLSGGQKKRLAIASVLAMRPQVLILDEPTADLDPMGKMEVLSVVAELKRTAAMTIIMVEQESEAVAAFADRVAVLYGGQIALEGSPREVFAQVERMRGYGLAVPQVSQLAHEFNLRQGTDFRFVTEEEAWRGLVEVLAQEG